MSQVIAAENERYPESSRASLLAWTMASLPEGLSSPRAAESYASQESSICVSILDFESEAIEQLVINKDEIRSSDNNEVLFITKVYEELNLYGTIKELSGPRIEHVTL